MKEAAVPLKRTAVAPVKLVPVMVTEVPTGPLVGLKELMLGGAGGVVTVKLLALVAVPPGVLTWIGPLVAPLGTVAVIWVLVFTVKLAAVPLKVTAVAPVKLVPLIVTEVPTGPLLGVNELIVGGEAVTVKLLALVAVPPGVVTLICPVVAPLGTIARTWVSESSVKKAAVPVKATPVVPVKWLPLIVTVVPTGPLVGLKELIVGGPTVTVKALLLPPVPAAVVTLIGPVVAPLGTVAWI